MACRAAVRESKAKRQAGITNNNAVQNLSMFSRSKEQATGSFEIADPSSDGTPAAPTGHPAIQYLHSARTSQDCGSSTAPTPEKSRLLRNAPFSHWCYDLLTTTVDNADRAGL
jgi:hypothetical protein